MPKFARPNSYTGKQSNQYWTGDVRAATVSEAIAGDSQQIYISPATLSSAVVALVPLATPTTPGIVTVTAAPFDTGPVATKLYADNLAIAGSPISEEAVNGIGQLATNSEAIAGTPNNPGVTALFVTPSNLSPVFASPPAIGGTAPAGGAFTTLSASGAFSLTGDVVQVDEGGTGAASLTDHGILLGSGTGAVSVTAVGTTGQMLIGQSGADPIWTTNVDLPGTLDVTGAATFDNDLTVVGTLTMGALSVDNIDISGNTISSTDTNGDINLTPDGTGVVNIPELALTTPLTVADGGTGAGTFTDHGIMLGSGTGALSVTAVGTTGQILIGQTGADPIWTTNLSLPGTLGVPSGLTTLSSLTVVGTTNINASGAAVTTIGTGGTGAVNIGNATGNTAVTGSLTTTTTLTATLGDITATNGNIVRGTAGNKDVYTSVATTIAAGANSAGTVTLVGGEAVVSTTAVTADSIIRLYRQGVGATGAAALGVLSILTRVVGTSFTIRAVDPADATAAQAADVSVIAWEIVN
jgi:hypothetical protein